MKIRYIWLAVTLGAIPVMQGTLFAQGPGAGRGGMAQGKAGAPIDLTGYWVSIVNEDWRYRMVTPTKGDYLGVPMNAEAWRIAEAWDPKADEAAGNQCKSYGAPIFMRLASRFRFTWVDDQTLKLESDAGTQTRLLHFEAPAKPGARSLQGNSAAVWERPAGGGRGSPPVSGGWLKVDTTNLKAGYLRKNGVPYSENTSVTEYFDLVPQEVPGNGPPLLVVTTIVTDPTYLTQRFIVNSQYEKTDASGWDPSPCSATW